MTDSGLNRQNGFFADESNSKTEAHPVVLVMGATDLSLGQSVAQYFAKQRAQVVTVNRPTGHSTVTAHLLRHVDPIAARDGVKACLWLKQVKEVVRQTVDQFRRIDIFISNVGPSLFESGESVPNDERAQLLDEYVHLTLEGCQAALEPMMAQQSGTVIMMPPVQALSTYRLCTQYESVIREIGHLTHCLASDMAPYNIRVNAIAPAIEVDPGHRSPVPLGHLESAFQRDQQQLTNRATDLAKVIGVLASDEANGITGQMLSVISAQGKFLIWNLPIADFNS